MVSDSGRLSATVGSCVTVVLWDPRTGWAAINHFLLPARATAGRQTDLSAEHFGDESTVRLLKEMKKRGSCKEDLRAWVAGGANTGSANFVGRDNIEMALTILRRFGIAIQQESVGGARGRRVDFDIAEGTFAVRLLGEDRPTEERVVKVLLLDSPEAVLQNLTESLGRDDRIRVVGRAVTVSEAERLRRETTPDLLIVDLALPNGAGLEYLRLLRNRGSKVPTVVVSDQGESSTQVVEAFALGAIHGLARPSLAERHSAGQQLREIAKALLERSSRSPAAAVTSFALKKRPKLIAIGSSTGGTAVIKSILETLPATSPPIVIVQHMPAAFTGPFAEGLNRSCRVRVKEGARGDFLEPGCAYLAPGGRHMRLKAIGDKLAIEITDDPPVNLFRPSVDVLFRSLARLEIARESIGIILTGMGGDGAEGLLELKKNGAVTVGQSAESCLVYGMPRVAEERGALCVSLKPAEIARVLCGERLGAA